MGKTFEDRLRSEIKRAESRNEPVDVRSFEDKIGIIISRREAKLILSLLEQIRKWNT